MYKILTGCKHGQWKTFGNKKVESFDKKARFGICQRSFNNLLVQIGTAWTMPRSDESEKRTWRANTSEVGRRQNGFVEWWVLMSVNTVLFQFKRSVINIF